MRSGSSISKCKDSGGNDLNQYQGWRSRDDNVPYCPYTADTHWHLSHDRDRNETVSTASNIKPILEFVQGNHVDPDNTSPHPTNNILAILHADARCADVVQHLPLQCPTHPSDFDHTRDSIPDIIHTPPATRFSNRPTATTYRTADTHHNPDRATSPQRHAILTLLRDIDAPHSTIFEALSHYESPRPVALPHVLASALLVHSLD